MDIYSWLRGLIFVKSLSDCADYLFYDPSSNKIYRMDEQILSLFGKKKSEFLKENGSFAWLAYNPYAESGPWTKEDETVPTFNTYVPPIWRHDAYFNNGVVEPGEFPDLVEKFFRHFSANDDRSFEFMLDWLATALHARNGTYLCILSKIQGTGKGVMGEMCRTIFGETNARKVRGDALNSRFNGQFANAQFVMFDEFDLKNETSLDRAKDLVNDKLEVEKKGRDAVEMPNQLNGMFASNHMGAIPEIGRRFSVPMTSDVQLKLIFSTKEIRALQYDKEMICEFAKWLWWRNVKRDMWLPFVSARTQEVRDYGLAEWESVLCEEVLNRCPKNAFIRQSDLKKILKDKAPYLRNSPGRLKFAELASKFPEHLKHHYKLNGKKQEWGISILVPFPDYQPDQWCEKCESLKPESCICRRDP